MVSESGDTGEKSVSPRVSSALDGLVDEIVSPNKESPSLSSKELQRISEWLNIPLDPSGKPIEVQITNFFRDHVVASGQEQMRIGTGPFGMNMINVNIPTAYVTLPREGHWGLKTRGWYLFHYLLKDGTQGIIVTEERFNLHRGGKEIATGASLLLLQKANESGFSVQRPPYAPVTSPYISVANYSSDEVALETYRRLYENPETKEIQMFHVYNQLPALPNNTALPDKK